MCWIIDRQLIIGVIFYLISYVLFLHYLSTEDFWPRYIGIPLNFTELSWQMAIDEINKELELEKYHSILVGSRHAMLIYISPHVDELVWCVQEGTKHYSRTLQQLGNCFGLPGTKCWAWCWWPFGNHHLILVPVLFWFSFYIFPFIDKST